MKAPVVAEVSALAEKISSLQRFVLTTHMNPDGDGLGAEVALAAAFQQLGKSVAVLNDEATPAEYRFLDPEGALKRYSPRRHGALLRDADMVVLMDAGSPSRTGRLGGELAGFRGMTAVIDHHAAVSWGELRLVDPTACSTTTLTLSLLKQLGVDLTPAMACALYAGVLVDTLSFRNANTTPDCLRTAAELVDLGADVVGVWRSFFADWPIGRARLQGDFLASLRASRDGRLVWSVVTREQLRRRSQTESAVEGFVERALDTRGAELAILFLEETEGTTRVSFRSKEPISVDGLARSLGGGGHRLAAGAILRGPPSQVVPDVLGLAKRLLTEAS